MNLHGLVAGNINAVNPFQLVSIQISTGNTVDSTYKQVPTYMAPIQASAQIQPVTFRDLQQVEGLNLQGTSQKIYISGQIAGLIRESNKGGDLITFPNGDIYLVVLVLEAFVYSGWCSVFCTLQNGS